MKIGIIGPSKLREKKNISKLAKIIAVSGNEIVVTPDKGSSSEFFAQKYLYDKGKKVWEVLPLDDVEFGYEWVNTEIGDIINCGTWRNQPEKFNTEHKINPCLKAVDNSFGVGFVSVSPSPNKPRPLGHGKTQGLGDEETDALLCIGYAVGVLAEIAYSKWFNPKPVYIIKELISRELPEDAVKGLDLRYISVDELEKELKTK